MDQREGELPLSRISTQWTVLRQAHQGPDAEAAAAREELMQRYCGAVYRYLLGAVRDPHAADDLTQDFALRFVQGRFRLADPGRGRFRDYVKTALFHLVDNHRAKQGRGPRGVPLEQAEPPAAADGGPEEQDAAFVLSWRKELLARAWKALARVQEESGQPCCDVLRLRVEQPDLQSPQMARELSERLGQPFTPAGVRQILHRAREKFADLLLEETRRSLGPDAQDRVEDELADLGLLKYCQTAMRRRNAG
jgi:RNA polymerase sigma-70 factor (ECF subfamily)